MPDHMNSIEDRLQEQINNPATENKLMRCIEIQHHLAEALAVKFGAYIQPDGELAYVTIEKFDQRITLTVAQAKSLTDQIKQRIGA